MKIALVKVLYQHPHQQCKIVMEKIAANHDSRYQADRDQ
jgi:hypothetical protein